MTKRRYLYQWVAVLAVIAFSSVFVIKANENSREPQNNANSKKRADIITINTIKSFGTLERKAVPFLHDAHTEALEKHDMSCEACHVTGEALGKEQLSFKFKRVEDTNRQEITDIYHTNCIGCHKEFIDKGTKAGPTELCGQCHRDESEIIALRKTMIFDKSLHFSHIEMNDNDCSICHHDNKKEASCRYCHKEESRNNLDSIKSVSHTSCIGCHRDLSGPFKCSECHSPEELSKINKIEDVPRMKVDQPDFVLLGANPDPKDGNYFSNKMNPVPFDHKAHEQYEDNCRTCHHAETGSCSKSCHTVTGSKNGALIRSEQAMHQLDSEKSCLGCHENVKKQRECAGCHGFMEKGRYQEITCAKCHIEMPEAGSEESRKPESMAAMLLESGKTLSDTIEDSDIPERVIIDTLSSEFGAVELLHRKHVDSLTLDIKDNNLASFFHDGKDTICLGCHHNSPASKNPPQCASCHSPSSDESASLRPDLKVAYHQQCMGCHDRMGIEKPESTSCTECHKVIGVNKLL